MPERLARAALVAGCAYEVAAVVTGRVPTITALNRRCPVIGVAIVVTLAWHFRAHDR
jgi:hypothetical protein